MEAYGRLTAANVMDIRSFAALIKFLERGAL
jgi:hypothetical protein